MRTQKFLFILITLPLCISLVCCGGSSSDDQSTEVIPEVEQPVPTPTQNEPLQRIWTVSEVLSEPKKGGKGQNVTCGGEFGFRRCVCAGDVPSTIRYRPALAECNNNAALFLSGDYIDIFSVVVRDTQNRDRFPEAGSGYGGCNFSLANSDDPPKRCSAFKVQDSFEVDSGSTRVHCFGASGYSDIFSDVVRITLKITDDPFSSEDELERHCLRSGDRPLN